MRLRKFFLKNFRSYKTATTIDVTDLTAFIGKNDIGKSTILEALEIFFNNTLVKIDASDVCVHASDTDIVIGCAFDQLPDGIVIDDSTATDLGEEYLLNADGMLEIHKRYECSGKIKTNVYAIAHHPVNEGVHDLLSLKIADLKKRISDHGINVSANEVNRSVNATMRKALWRNCTDLHLETVSIQLDKVDVKDLWSKIEKYLPVYALFQADRPSKDDDAAVQDPMQIAVKSALKSMEKKLEEIKQTVREEVIEVANRTLVKLKELDSNLADELTPDFKGEPKWDGLFKMSLSSDDQIPINKRGSGVRRLILLSFFRAEAERKLSAANASSVIYAIEEPETAQHPDNQKMLIEALKELSEKDGCQILLTTHVPGLAGMLPPESIRYISKDESGNVSIGAGSDDIYRTVAENLGVLPDPVATDELKLIICVEGNHDVHFLTCISRKLHSYDQKYPCLASDPRVIILPLGGSSLKEWVRCNYLRKLGKPEWHLYDKDAETPPKYGATCDKINARGGGHSARLTLRREMENYFHPAVIADVFAIDVKFDPADSVPSIIAKSLHEQSNSPNNWDTLEPKTQKDKISNAKKRLNEAVHKMNYERIIEIDASNEVIGWFDDIAKRIG